MTSDIEDKNMYTAANVDNTKISCQRSVT